MTTPPSETPFDEVWNDYADGKIDCEAMLHHALKAKEVAERRLREAEEELKALGKEHVQLGVELFITKCRAEAAERRNEGMKDSHDK